MITQKQKLIEAENTASIQNPEMCNASASLRKNCHASLKELLNDETSVATDDT